MCFRLCFRRAGVFLLSGILLAGCDAKIGERPPPLATQQVSGTQCISDSLPTITRFIEGQAADQEVAATWDCFGSALEKFKKYVRGNSTNQYTPQELSTFLQDNFFDQSKGKKVITPALQTEVMKFKQIFIGGRLDALTMDELDTALQLFKKFRAMTLQINPYMKILGLNWAVSAAAVQARADSDFFEKANTNLQDIARQMADLVQVNHPAYRLGDFASFITELNGLYEKPWDFQRLVAEFIPFVEKLKVAVVGGDESKITANEWQSFLLLGGRGYIQYLRYRYFIQTALDTKTQIHFFSVTLQDGFSAIRDLLAQKTSGAISRAELTGVLQAAAMVWPQLKISDELVLQGLKIKKSLLGGTSESMDKIDFANALPKVVGLQVVAENLLPFYHLYRQDWDPRQVSDESAQAFYDQAEGAAAKAGLDVGALMTASYDLQDLRSLAHEILTLYPQLTKVSESSVQKLLPLITDAKNTIFAESDSVLRRERWSSSLNFLARGYCEFIYYNYFGDTLQTLQGLQSMSVIVGKINTLFQDMLNQNGNKKFAQTDLAVLAKDAVTAELLPRALAGHLSDIVVDVLLNRGLVAPEKRIAGQIPSAFNLPSLVIFYFEAQSWLNTEKFLVSLFPTTQERYSPAQIQKLVGSRLQDSSLASPEKSALTELAMMLNSPLPLTINQKNYRIISRIRVQSYDQNSLSQLNLNRLVARILIRAYSTDKARINNYLGINLVEAKQAFKELRPVAIAMDLIEPDNVTFADSRFREASIFVPRSNGDDLVSFLEGSDLVGMIWSGVSLNIALKKELSQACFVGHPPLTGSMKVPLTCLESIYHQVFPLYMTSLPDYVQAMKNVPMNQWADYFMNVLKAAGHVPNSTGLAKMSDVSLVPHVIQYVEMVFALYDANSNGVLDTTEALKAFPVFRTLIKKFANGSVDDKDLDSVFTYILKYGKPPESWSDKLWFLAYWKGHPGNWDVSADRMQLAKILGYIADQTAKVPVTESDPASTLVLGNLNQ